MYRMPRTHFRIIHKLNKISIEVHPFTEMLSMVLESYDSVIVKQDDQGVVCHKIFTLIAVSLVPVNTLYALSRLMIGSQGWHSSSTKVSFVICSYV